MLLWHKYINTNKNNIKKAIPFFFSLSLSPLISSYSSTQTQPCFSLLNLLPPPKQESRKFTNQESKKSRKSRMEAATRNQESQKNQISPLNSPHSSNNNGVQIQTYRSDNNNPYPTTFVQADTSTFKQVVQMLTGSPSTDSSTTTTSPPKQQDPTRNFSIPPIKNSPKRQQQQQQQNNSFKLYERRNSNLKNTLIINTLLPNFGNNNNNSPSRNNKTDQLLSPSLLDFPKLKLSPITPLNEDTFNNSSPSTIGNSSSSSEEERAIAEKGFYLHPSPISTPRDSEPQLLSLFPVTSPKVSGSSF